MSRVFAARFAFVVGVTALAARSLVACSETRRGNGDDCLKNDDCLSGICASQKCAAGAPILPPGVPGDAGGVGQGDAAQGGDAGDDGATNDGATPLDGALDDGANDGATGDGAAD